MDKSLFTITIAPYLLLKSEIRIDMKKKSKHHNAKMTKYRVKHKKR